MAAALLINPFTLKISSFGIDLTETVQVLKAILSIEEDIKSLMSKFLSSVQDEELLLYYFEPR